MKFNKDEIGLIEDALMILINEFEKDIIRYAPDFPEIARGLLEDKKKYDNLLRRIRGEKE